MLIVFHGKRRPFWLSPFILKIEQAAGGGFGFLRRAHLGGGGGEFVCLAASRS
jgi:hypothetical protein